MKTPKRKVYSKQVKDIVAGALKLAEEKRRQGWTRKDSAAALKRMFDSPTGDDGETR